MSKRSNTSFTRVEEFLRAHGSIQPQQSYTDFLLKGQLITPGESPDDMFQRVATTLASAGNSFYGSKQRALQTAKFKELLSKFRVVLSTPIYTNAGRHKSKPLSACAVPSVDMRAFNVADLQQLISSYHVKGMGTGFNLDDADDPVTVLKLLNSLAVAEVQNGIIERPVGNMAILSINHPKVMEFVKVKEQQQDVADWKFNISVNLPAAFFKALRERTFYTTSYGIRIAPEEFLQHIASSASKTGDPGVVFMHRHEQGNKVPHLGSYVTVAPCGEVPLLDGEVCHFGYINLYSLIKSDTIDYEELRYAVHQTVLMLDNAIELSLENMVKTAQPPVVARIRRIGIGVCGFADALMALGAPYNSPEALKIAANIISFINYESKLASVELAKTRGSFPEFCIAQTRRDLILGDYKQSATDMVSMQDWNILEQSIQRHGIRNISTVILPPTGRSALLGGVSASIEPPFKLKLDPQFKLSLTRACNQFNYHGDRNKLLEQVKNTGSAADTDLPQQAKKIFQNCLELSPTAHLDMAAQFQQFTDEAISKTVNLPASASSSDVAAIYSAAYFAGLKGVTVYVDQSRSQQPIGLKAKL